KSYKLSFIIFLLTFFSCKNQDSSDNPNIKVVKSDDAILFSQYFGEINHIILDESQPIGTVERIIATDSFIVLSAFDLLTSLHVYDSKGNLIASKDDIGEGPDGLGEINDFAVWNDEIYVLQSYSRKISKFDFKLNMIDEMRLKFPASSFHINSEGIFLYHLEKNPQFPFRLSYLDHPGVTEQIGLIPFDERLTAAPMRGNFFIDLDSDSFLHYHPASDSIYWFEGKSHSAFRLDFGDQFFDVGQLGGLHPLEQLKLYNEFEGFNNLNNGVRLSQNEALFNIIHKNKQEYLLVDLMKKEARLVLSLKNDLAALPSKVSFNGNNSYSSWYWQQVEDIRKFYQLNSSKIADKQKIELPEDREGKVVFKAEYK
uniref:6-bladed beta-propeller n=1 Tax=Aquiflexum sp. TaxID=1872584 RepID=UPI0035946C6D